MNTEYERQNSNNNNNTNNNIQPDIESFNNLLLSLEKQTRGRDKKIISEEKIQHANNIFYKMLPKYNIQPNTKNIMKQMMII